MLLGSLATNHGPMHLPVEGENAAGSSVEGCVPVEGITREISCWQAALSPVAGILWLSVESILLFSAASRPQHSQGCMSCAMMTNVKEEEPGQKPTSRDEPGQEQTLAEPKHEEATSAEQPIVAPLPSNVPCTLKEQIEGAFMQCHISETCVLSLVSCQLLSLTLEVTKHKHIGDLLCDWFPHTVHGHTHFCKALLHGD